MKILVVLCLMSMFFSFSAQNIIGNCYSTIQNEIKAGNWKFVDSLNHFVTNKPFTNKLKSSYQDCLKMLNENQVLTLFGKPTSTEEDGSNHRLCYLITSCGKYDNCSYFIFLIDSNSKVSSLFIETSVYTVPQN